MSVPTQILLEDLPCPTRDGRYTAGLKRVTNEQISREYLHQIADAGPQNRQYNREDGERPLSLHAVDLPLDFVAYCDDDGHEHIGSATVRVPEDLGIFRSATVRVERLCKNVHS